MGNCMSRRRRRMTCSVLRGCTCPTSKLETPAPVLRGGIGLMRPRDGAWRGGAPLPTADTEGISIWIERAPRRRGPADERVDFSFVTIAFLSPSLFFFRLVPLPSVDRILPSPILCSIVPPSSFLPPISYVYYYSYYFHYFDLTVYSLSFLSFPSKW